MDSCCAAGSIFPEASGEASSPNALRVALLVLDYFAAFHHEPDVFERGDVGDRISVNGDDVCEFAGLECAYAIGPAKEIGGVYGGGLDRDEWWQAHFYHSAKLSGVHSVGV